MGSVQLALKLGALGFQRLMAVKRLHPHLATDANFVARFKDEIRLLSRLTHPNIAQAFDVLEVAGELTLVMEFVDGVTLNELQRDARDAGQLLALPVAVGLVNQALHGLHAAHEAVCERGQALLPVHRDVSPQNIMIGKDGLVKVVDFGVAKAASAAHVTVPGKLHGKVSYMSPEQVAGRAVDRRTDVFAAGVVLWEALCGRRLFGGPDKQAATTLTEVLSMRIPPPSELRGEVSEALDRIVLRALDRDPARRFGSALDFALALEEAAPSASASAISGAVAMFSSARIREHQQARASFTQQMAQWHDAPSPFGNEPTALPSPALEVSAANIELRSPLEDVTPSTSPANALEPELETSDVQRTLGLGRTAAPSAGTRTFQPTLIAVTLLVAGALIALLASQREKPSSNGASFRQSLPSSTVAQHTPDARATAVGTAAPLATPTAIPVVDLATLPPRETQPTRRRAPIRKRSTQGAAHLVTNPCVPPTYVDLDGIRHFKADCL